jgi:hypothetical protein
VSSRAQAIDQAAQAPDPHAERAGSEVAARQQVEVAREGQGRGEPDGQHGQRRPRSGGATGIAHQPEQHAFDSPLRGQAEDQGHRCAAAGGDDDAGEQQPGLRPGPVAMGQAEDQQGGAQRTGEGAAVMIQPAAAPEQHGEQRADRRAAGNAQHVGVGQRVAQQHLHQRAGQGQQAAAGEGGQGARQAQATDDVRLHAAFGTGQGGKQVVDGDRQGTGREGPGEGREGRQHQAQRPTRGSGRTWHRR